MYVTQPVLIKRTSSESTASLPVTHDRTLQFPYISTHHHTEYQVNGVSILDVMRMPLS
jgi:hypothetical protein